MRRLRSGALTSLDTAKESDRTMLYDAVMGEAKTAEQVLNTVLEVVHVTFMPARKTVPATGEVEMWVRSVLTLADGSRVAFGSQGIIKSLCLFVDCFGEPPWNPPARFMLKSEKVGAGKWFTLVQAPTEPADKLRRKS